MVIRNDLEMVELVRAWLAGEYNGPTLMEVGLLNAWGGDLATWELLRRAVRLVARIPDTELLGYLREIREEEGLEVKKEECLVEHSPGLYIKGC